MNTANSKSGRTILICVEDRRRVKCIIPSLNGKTETIRYIPSSLFDGKLIKKQD
jgi:hypothetical protein